MFVDIRIHALRLVEHGSVSDCCVEPTHTNIYYDTPSDLPHLRFEIRRGRKGKEGRDLARTEEGRPTPSPVYASLS